MRFGARSAPTIGRSRGWSSPDRFRDTATLMIVTNSNGPSSGPSSSENNVRRSRAVSRISLRQTVRIVRIMRLPALRR